MANVVPMTPAELQADQAVREASVWPRQDMRPDGARFPRTYINEDVNLSSCRAFASRLSPFAQTEVFKGTFKDIGLEEAIVGAVARGAVVSEDRAVLFVSVPRAIPL